MVRRVLVEKKQEFAVEAKGLLTDIRQNLGIENLENLRIVNRYDIEGMDDETYDLAKYSVFAEPAVDVATDERMDIPKGAVTFSAEYLPGQYDQRADSAQQCVKLMNPETDVLVKFARLYILEGDISEEDLKTIKEYVINPVDSQEAAEEIPETLEMMMTDPADVAVIDGFREMNDEEIEVYRKDMAFAMSPEDIKVIREYFAQEEMRDPTMTELKVIDTYWSDHCRHTTFNTELTDIEFDDVKYGKIVKAAFDEYMAMRGDLYAGRDKSLCLMDMASIGTKYIKSIGKGEDLDESEEINACSIKVKADIDGKEEDWLVMFKNETHNHPTEIEPFGGAATCLGGAIRDPLSGRVYVYQAMRVTGAGDPRTPVKDTIKGKLPQRKIVEKAAHGYSSYGNQIGLATGLVDEVYDEDYVAKRMEVGAVIGAAPAENVVRERPVPGDAVILVGGRTGRDGCGGATGSSKEHTQDSILECGAEVQKGNPPVERNLQRLFRRKEVATLIRRCNDFGAGGVSVAIGELAESLDIDLDLVPKKYEGLDGTELAISESQERMAVVVDAGDVDKFIKYANSENLEATKVADVTDTGRVKMTWRGKEVLNLKRSFLDTNGAKQYAKVKVVPESDHGIADMPAYDDVREYLSDLNCCSKKGLIERFDSTIGANSVLMPLGGKNRLSPAMGMSAKLPVTDGETTTASLMAYGYDPKLAKISPFHGALYSVVDSVTKIAAMGGDISTIRLTFQEYFEKLTGKESWGKPLAALLGGLKAQKELEIPAIGGKDSMSGTFEDIKVPPALISFAVTTTDARKVISTEFKKPGSNIVFIKAKRKEDETPDFVAYKKAMAKVHELAMAEKILAASAVGYGGVFMAVIKMAVGNGIGADIANISESELKDRGYGGILLEISGDEDIVTLMGDIPFTIVGETRAEAEVSIDCEETRTTLLMDEIIKTWQEPLEEIFPVRTSDYKHEEEGHAEKAPSKDRIAKGPVVKTAKPKVLIPAFPGTNCEFDSKRAFERAGAEAEIVNVRNMDKASLRDSIRTLEKKIGESQIVMIPGGFSGGDEPEGSAKFITAIFRNPGISEAVTKLLDDRDGLMLGICNGFQALVKLGLVPYGKITEARPDSPTLTYNKIGRHQSQLVDTRVASKLSPWFEKVDEGDVFTVAVSHGEGNFVCNDEILKELKAGGQIATQYVDFNGEPSMDIKFNPNHSVMAIEGITSPDGRVLGKMGHSERISDCVYKNVPGNKDMKIFESGVAYFK